MVQVLSKLHVPVAPGSDMEVTLHPVQVQATKDATAVTLAAAQLGRLGPLGPLATQAHNVVDVLLAEALLVLLLLLLGGGHVALARDDAALLVPVQLVVALLVDPLRPHGGVAVQARGREDAVAGGVLDVDVQVGALHAHDRVEIDLHGVAHALLDREGVLLGAAPPPGQLGPDEHEGDDDHGDGPFPAA